jgi:hypothetical protein
MASADPHPAGSVVPVQRADDGTAYVAIRGLQPSEVLVLTNRAEASEGAVIP